jgi:uroporphyrinogen-III synthase
VVVPPELLSGQVDVAVFASPSSVEHFCAVLGEERAVACLRRLDVACIGPTTAAAVARLGLAVQVQPEESTAAGLVAALRSHCARRSS